jgi:predicted protein tyrosine phosphatase
MHKVLFICSRNLLRSPTAEQVFASWPDVETSSAGLDHDAAEPVTPELLEWADTIFVMEPAHRRKLSSRFGRHIRSQRVICLNIPDDYELMDERLVRLLMTLVPKHLPSRPAER